MTTISPPKPSPWEISQAVETLRSAGCVFVVPSELRSYTAAEAAVALRVTPKWIKEHLNEFPGTIRLAGGHLRIPYKAIVKFAVNHRTQ